MLVQAVVLWGKVDFREILGIGDSMFSRTLLGKHPAACSVWGRQRPQISSFNCCCSCGCLFVSRLLQLTYNGKEVPDSEQLSKLGLVNTTASIKVGGALLGCVLSMCFGVLTTALCAVCDTLVLLPFTRYQLYSSLFFFLASTLP